MRKLFIYNYGVTKIVVLNIAELGGINFQGESGNARLDIRVRGHRYSFSVYVTFDSTSECICCTYDIISARYRLLTTAVCNYPHNVVYYILY